jgi:hypothetical protein
MFEIQFSLRNCDLFPGTALQCKETFSLLFYEFDPATHKPPRPTRFCSTPHCTTMRAKAAAGKRRQEERQFLFLSDSTSSEDRKSRAKLQGII